MCDHDGHSCRLEKAQTRSDGAIMQFATKTCGICGEEWRDLKITKTNLTLAEYLRHFSGGLEDHSENSPTIKEWREGEVRSGEQYPDTYIEYVECKICKKWATQKHQW